MKVVVELALIDELWVIRIDWLNFDGNFKVGLGVDGLVDLSEGSLVNFADDFEVLPYLLQHLWHGKNVM